MKRLTKAVPVIFCVMGLVINPIAYSLSNTVLNTGSPSGTTVGTLPNTSYTLTAGTGDEDNGKFTIVGNELRTNFVPDINNPTDLGDTAGNNTYSIRVTGPQSFLKGSETDYSRSGSGNSNSTAFAFLTDAGAIRVWGNTAYGGSQAQVDAHALNTGETYTKIYSTGFAFAALTSEGRIKVWGNGSRGGNQAQVDAILAGLKPDETITNIYSGTFVFAALTSQGRIKVWGDTSHGGLQTLVPNLDGDTPSSVPNLQLGEIFVDVKLMEEGVAALTSQGRVKTWGSSVNQSQFDLFALNPSETYTKIYRAGYSFAALTSQGRIRAWGQAANGGSQAQVDAISLAPGETYVGVYPAGVSFSALTSNNNIKVWGNGVSQAEVDAHTFSPGETFTDKIYTNSGAYIGFTSLGNAKVWGSDSVGGDQGEFDALPLESGETITDKIYSAAFSFAMLTSQGRIIAWGANNFGGDNNRIPRLDGDTPYSAPNLLSGEIFTDKIYPGTYGFAAITNQGRIKFWGHNVRVGSQNDIPNLHGDTPSSVPNLAAGETFVDVYSNTRAFAALTSDNNVKVWGQNNHGGDQSMVSSGNVIANHVITVGDFAAPGGVHSGLEFWSKADVGTNLDASSNLTASGDDPWKDQSGKNRHISFVNSDPQYQENVINFNPAIDWDGDDYATDSSGGNYFTSFMEGEQFGVAQESNISANSGFFQYFGGNGGVAYYTYADAGLYDDFGSNIGNRRCWVPSNVHGGVNPTGFAGCDTNNVVLSGNNVLTTDWNIFNSGINSSIYTAHFNGQLAYIDTSVTPNFSNSRGNMHLGATSPSYEFIGKTAEHILYSRKLSVLDRQKIQSYLALKYGITLDQTTATAYIASNGTTKIWDETLNAAYNKNIFGIGRDDASALYQKVSKSMKADAIVTVSLDSDFTSANDSAARTASISDLSFFAMAHNGGSTNTQTTELDKTRYNERISREWQIQKENFTQSVNLKFDGFDDEWSVLTDVDGDFSSGAVNVGALSATGEITGLDFADGVYVTLAKPGAILNVEFLATTGSDLEASGGNLPLLNVSGGIITAPKTIEVIVTGGSATSGIDYSFTSPTTVTIPAADYTTARTVVISPLSIINDGLTEDNETIIFGLQNPSVNLLIGDVNNNANIASVHTYTITNGASVGILMSEPGSASKLDIVNVCSREKGKCYNVFPIGEDKAFKDYKACVNRGQGGKVCAMKWARLKGYENPEEFKAFKLKKKELIEEQKCETKKYTRNRKNRGNGIANGLFSDVLPTDTFYEYLLDLGEQGIVSGDEGTGHARLTDFINRAEVAKLLTIGREDSLRVGICSRKKLFEDVESDSWYYSYVANAVSSKVVSGYPDGMYRPKKNINKSELYKMLSIGFGYTTEALSETDREGGKKWYDSYKKALESSINIPLEISRAPMNKMMSRGEVFTLLSLVLKDRDNL